MKIGIDARFFGPFGKGLGRYTQKLIEYLEKVDLENQYIIYLKKENFDDYQPKNNNFTKKLADVQWYTVNEQFAMPKILNKENFDLVHFPHFNIPVFYRKPFVATIHDVIITNHPTTKATTLGPLLYKIKQLGYKFVIRSAVKRAKKVIAVSGYSKSEILRHFKTTSEKVVVTYESSDFNKDVCSIHDPEYLKSKFNISPHYWLYVGNAYPHKNLEILVKSWKRLKADNFTNKLVLVGKEDYFYTKIKELVKQEGLEEMVVFTGFVNDAELCLLYQQAVGYIFPSLCEGFGLPPLEAASQGAPVLTSSSSCLPEVMGNAALYFDPYSIDDIVEKVKIVTGDKNLQESLRESGLKQVKKYSWRKTAEETLAVYRSVLK